MSDNQANTEKSFGELDLMVMVDIANNSNINQRAMAEKHKVSLGKINYCIRALVDIGFVKLDNFSNAQNKLNYIYLLTPEGIAAMISLTKKFLKIKQDEFNQLKELLSSQ